MAKTTNNVVHHVRSYAEHLEAVEAGRKAPNHNTPTGHGGGNWYGVSSTAEARTLEVEGHHKTSVDVGAIKRRVEDTVFAHKAFQTSFVANWDVCGSEVDIAAFLEGTPECMIEAEPIRIAKAGRAVQLVIPICNSSIIEPETMERRGAAVLALIDCLLLAQHPLDLWAVHAVHGQGGRWVEAFQVQRADEPVNEGRIQYVFAHPASLRSTGFNSQDSEPTEIRRRFGFGVDGGGYGSPGFEARPEDVPRIDGTCIVVPALTSNNGWDEDSSVAWVEAQLRLIFGE